VESWIRAFGHKGRESFRIEPPASKVVTRLGVLSKWVGIAAILLGYHVLAGWVFDIDVLVRPNGFPPTVPGAAVCAILSGLGLYLLQSGVPRLRANAPTFVPFLGWLSVAAAVAGLWLPKGKQLSLYSVVAFSFVGAAVALRGRDRFPRFAEALGALAGAMSTLVLAGYAYHAERLYGQMPCYSALMGLLLSCGILWTRSDRGFMASVSSDSFGGLLARRLLPAVLIIPIALGWIEHRGFANGYFGPGVGLALLAVANVVVLVLVVWRGVVTMHRMDAHRRGAELELKETAARLRRSNYDLEQFAYVASHDLKEPLRAIGGSVQLLEAKLGGQLAPENRNIFRMTLDGALRMQKLIDDLLTYSRLTSREAPLEPVDSAAVFQDVLTDLKPGLDESGAVLNIDTLPVVRADRTQLGQIFQNLISNAIKYRSSRTLKIHIGVQDKGSEWQFSVRDNGIGIPPQYADKVFKIFQRLHPRNEYPGTGIGLAIAKKVVERHGGRIWFESEPEEGSTFFFTLPK
jgi:signal transduction histidine kinase